ncbi:hypothetical protein M3Y98_01172800 [Aphelenchoides besseyi]|nr:hypothetical protein M3Y98_01172800 [Aphelenchoides besseyi]KAI6210986.1 hypothetical protein M3Y96_00385600 [Aphelenchoides besseyi]
MIVSNRMQRHDSFYSLRDLFNDTIRLGDRPAKYELIFSAESKHHPEFGQLRESDIVGDRLKVPSLVMSFLILGSVLVAVVVIFAKHLILQRRLEREMEQERKQSEETMLPDSDDLTQQQTHRSSHDRRRSILNVFREFRL